MKVVVFKSSFVKVVVFNRSFVKVVVFRRCFVKVVVFKRSFVKIVVFRRYCMLPHSCSCSVTPWGHCCLLASLKTVILSNTGSLQ